MDKDPLVAGTPCLVIRRSADGVEMERRPIERLDERYVARAIAEWTRGAGLSPTYYIDDTEVAMERRRLSGELDEKIIAKQNRDAFGDRGGLIKGMDYRD